MDLHNKKVKIALGIVVALGLVISYRIYSNIQGEKARAAKIAQARTIAVEMAQPQRQTIIPKLSFSGSLDPHWQAQVAAKVDGRIEKVYVQEGDRVIQGQVLAILEQTDTNAALVAAQGAYVDANINLRKAEADLDRYEKLYAGGAISEQMVVDYRFAKINAEAKLDVARGNLQAMESQNAGTVLVAPASGIVAKRYYQEGYYAKAGTPVFAIADISSLKTTIDIPEGQVAGVAVGSEAEIFVPAYPDKKIIGRIIRIAPVADLPAHTFAAEVSVDNSQGLLAGVYANVTVTGVPKENMLTIPVHAIVMRDDQQTAFVVDAKGVVGRRVLTIGYSDDKIAEVLAGLEDGDTVVTGGHNKIREGSKVTVAEGKSIEKAGK